jgi:hypothetical protein
VGHLKDLEISKYKRESKGNNVSNLYNNSAVAKIYGMAYIFTLLMFRKPNKTTITKINFY